MVTRPSSLMSMVAPVSLVILLMVSPPLPMIAPILSGLTMSFSILGAYGDNSGFGVAMTEIMWSRMCARPALLCSMAVFRILTGRPWTFMSIWRAVIPFAVPVTLKSMSPAKSSASAMSDRT